MGAITNVDLLVGLRMVLDNICDIPHADIPFYTFHVVYEQSLDLIELSASCAHVQLFLDNLQRKNCLVIAGYGIGRQGCNLYNKQYLAQTWDHVMSSID